MRRLLRAVAARGPDTVRAAAAGVTDAADRARGFSTAGVRRLAASGAFRDRSIVAGRFDGFGMRLGEIMNAWRVAEALGARFRFAWADRDLSGIRPADEVFAPGFLDAHLIPARALPGLARVRVWTPGDVRRLHGTEDGGVWFESKYGRWPDERFQVRTRGFRFSGLPTMRDAFDRLELAPPLEDVRRTVMARPVADLAIHVRRGDVAVGEYRLGGSFADKALPRAVIAELARRYRTPSGGRVLLVGEGADVLAADVPGAIAADDDLPVPDHLAVLRDLCLLARSARVVAGRSAFARVATLVGGGALQDLDAALPSDVVERVVLAQIRSAPPGPDAETALACAHLLDRAGLGPSDALRSEILARAATADPGNPVVVAARAADLVRRGAAPRAVAVLAEHLPGGPAATILRAIRVQLGLEVGLGFDALVGTVLRREDLDLLLGVATASPWAAYLLGVDALWRDDVALARRLLDEAASALDDPSVAAAAGLAVTSARGPDAAGGGSIFGLTDSDLGGDRRPALG